MATTTVFAEQVQVGSLGRVSRRPSNGRTVQYQGVRASDFETVGNVAGLPRFLRAYPR